VRAGRICGRDLFLIRKAHGPLTCGAKCSTRLVPSVYVRHRPRPVAAIVTQLVTQRALWAGSCGKADHGLLIAVRGHLGGTRGASESPGEVAALPVSGTGHRDGDVEDLGVDLQPEAPAVPDSNAALEGDGGAPMPGIVKADASQVTQGVRDAHRHVPHRDVSTGASAGRPEFRRDGRQVPPPRSCAPPPAGRIVWHAFSLARHPRNCQRDRLLAKHAQVVGCACADCQSDCLDRSASEAQPWGAAADGRRAVCARPEGDGQPRHGGKGRRTVGVAGVLRRTTAGSGSGAGGAGGRRLHRQGEHSDNQKENMR
jgi:hypothetical protein